MRIEHLNPGKTAIMVIDMQNDFVRPGAPLFSQMGYDFVPTMAAFLNECRKRNMLIVYTRATVRPDKRDIGRTGEFCEPILQGKALVDGSDGAEIFAPIAPKDGDVVIQKHKYDSFYATELDIILRGAGIETVVISGVCTEACCFNTARGAGFREYSVAFLSDLTGTMDYEDMGFGPMTAQQMHEATLTNIALTTGHVMTSKELLALADKSL